MHKYIVLLSDLSYKLGLIGIAEYEERSEVAHWLSEEGLRRPDPRCVRNEEQERPRESDEVEKNEHSQPQDGSESANTAEDYSTDRLLQFLAFNKWMFTVGDRDCYPSVPHGHLHRKTNEWPKLNPYTGRVFSAVHAEDIASRLTRAEMKTLWSDGDFVDHCRKQVLWYSDFAPSYEFPNARFGRLRFPRW